MALDCDEKQIEEFLLDVLDRDFYHLCRINPKKESAAAVGFVAFTVDEAIDWIYEWQNKNWNIYFQWNRPDKRFKRRPKREDIKVAHGYHLDLDPPKNCADIPAWRDEIFPTLFEFGRPHIIKSGNGLQAFWPFVKPRKANADVRAEIEDINRRLIRWSNTGKGPWEINRLMRVPGTINIPGPTKIALGRKRQLAELLEVTDESFTADDFASLPALPAPVRSGDLSGRKVNLLSSKYVYTPDYTPLTFEDLLKIDPIIEDAHEERVANREDRSDANYGLIHDVIRAVCDEYDIAAADMLEDLNFRKNIVNLVYESDVSTLSKYEDGNRWSRLTEDVDKALGEAADDGVGEHERGRKRAQERRDAHARDQRPEDNLTPMDGRLGLFKHVREAIELHELPNAVFTKGKDASPKQSATESNVRAVLQAAGIVAKWDVMRDRALFDVLPTAGAIRRKKSSREAREDEARRPQAYFRAALARTSPDMLGAAQESLLCDALHECGISQRDKLPKLMEVIAKETRFHPIEAFCRAAPWDGEDHISRVADCVFSTHPLKGLYLRLFFRQCVAAVKSLANYLAGGEGLQISGVPVLEGAQFIGKSTFWEKITPAGFLARASGGLQLGTNKEADSKRECLSGLVAVLNEIGASMSRSEAEALKNFLTSTFDEFRTAYAHYPVSKPRMTVFVGTSNKLVLKDPTGSRRYWVMQVTGFDFESLAGVDLQQVYAQAWHEVMNEGRQWWLTPEEDKIRARENAMHQIESEEMEALDSYLNCVGERHEDRWLSRTQIMDLIGLRAKFPAKIKAIGEILAAEQFEFHARMKIDGQDIRNVYKFPVLPEKFKLLTQ